MKLKYLLLAVAALGGVWTAVKPAFAQDWTLTSAPSNNWQTIASSSDGNKLVAGVLGGPIYVSTNSGTTWVRTTAPDASWLSLATSSDGTRVVAAAEGLNGGIYSSADSGATWTLASTPSFLNWVSVATSADGAKLAALAVFGGIYTSTNSGATWRLTSAPVNEEWSSVTSSADGKKLAAASISGLIYISANAGVTWTASSAPNGYWTAIASSADGSKLVGASYLDGLYTSTNSGANWIRTGPQDGGPQSSIATSGDGSKWVVVNGVANYPGYSVTSADSGTTWWEGGFGYWTAVAASSDGTRWVAVVWGGGIYTWRVVGPVLTGEPAGPGQTLLPGSKVTFGVAAFSQAPMTYQWRFNGTNLPGATGATLTLTNLTPANSGLYAVALTNSLGSALSDSAMLTVVAAFVTTEWPTSITINSVTLNGMVVANVETVVWFDWGADTNYGNVTGVATSPQSWTVYPTITNTLSGLSEGTVYHYRMVAANDFGIVYGDDQSFVPGLSPTVTSFQPTGITTNGATLNATINPNGPDTTVYFVWGTTTNYSQETPSTVLSNGTNSVNFDSAISGLAAGTIYHYLIVACNALGCAYGSDFSFLSSGPWVQTTAPVQGWQTVASSADGAKLIAGTRGSGIYVSTNSGTDWWATAASTNGWYAIASSSDGTKLVAAPYNIGPIYVSTNSAITWTTNGARVELWGAVASSASGGRLVAAAVGGPIYTSTDSGATWTPTTAPSTNWTSIASSASGSKLTASTSDAIYTSADTGATWVRTSAPAYRWAAVASSADGTKLVGVGGSEIFTSTNSGATWACAGSPNGRWSSVASSADGNKLAVAAGDPLVILG